MGEEDRSSRLVMRKTYPLRGSHIDRFERLHVGEDRVEVVIRNDLVVLREIRHRRIELATVAGDPLGERALELGKGPGRHALCGEIGGDDVLLWAELAAAPAKTVHVIQLVRRRALGMAEHTVAQSHEVLAAL